MHKRDIAKRQLETALELHFAGGDTFSVITLAGAAEEVFGDLLRRADKAAMVDHLLDLDREVTGGRSPDIVYEEVNGIRNSLKHAKRPEEDDVEVEAEHAVSMLMRAIANYAALAGELSPAMVRMYRAVKERQ